MSSNLVSSLCCKKLVVWLPTVSFISLSFKAFQQLNAVKSTSLKIQWQKLSFIWEEEGWKYTRSLGINLICTSVMQESLMISQANFPLSSERLIRQKKITVVWDFFRSLAKIHIQYYTWGTIAQITNLSALASPNLGHSCTDITVYAWLDIQIKILWSLSYFIY